jgi:hypothetical protein
MPLTRVNSADDGSVISEHRPPHRWHYASVPALAAAIEIGTYPTL